MSKPHPKPSDADPRLAPLDEIIGSAMSLDPAKRPQAADEVGRTLRKFLSGTDTSDLAKALGERVRTARQKLREEAKAKAKSKADASGEFRASQASYGDLQTKTFAAREEVHKLTPGPGGIPLSTRKMGDNTPLAAIEPIAAPKSGTPKSVPPETIATRPLAIETPHKPVREEPPRNFKTPLLFVATVIVVAAATVGIMRWRELPGGSNPVTALSTTAASTSATATPSAPATSTAAPTNTTSAPTTTSTAAGTSTATSTSTVSATGAKSHLALFGDPGTRVVVDGVARGACPVRDLTLDPGTHDVRFTFDPTGESRGERIELRPGEKVTLRADFAGTIPTIHRN